jgi:pimeloyl-ACP methyl ester carboxylesterase
MKKFPSSKKRIHKFNRTILPAVIIIMAGILFLFGFLTHNIAHPDAAAEQVAPSHYLLPSLEIELPMEEDPAIPAWWIPGLKYAPGIILAPGYGMSRSDALSLAVALNQHGFNLLVYDQRGSGAVTRGASSLGLRETDDMRSAIRFLQSRPDINPKRLGIWGVDVSAFAALKAADAFPEVRAIVADSVYERVEDFLFHRINEDFGIDNRFVQFGCFQMFRLAHFFKRAALRERIRYTSLQDKEILFIQGENREGVASLTAAVHDRIHPRKELISLGTSRIHAMSGEMLKDYDRRVADFFHNNLQ